MKENKKAIWNICRLELLVRVILILKVDEEVEMK